MDRINAQLQLFARAGFVVLDPNYRGSPTEVPGKYHERSPIDFVANIQGDLLIIQGDQDPNVTPENVRVVNNALNDAGIAYEILTFHDEGHGISKAKNQKSLYLALLQFFNRAFLHEGSR